MALSVNVDVNLERTDCPQCNRLFCLGLCSSYAAHHGLPDREDRRHPPTPLLELGIDDKLWNHWMIEEWDKTRAVRRNCFWECLLMFFSGFLFLSCLAYGKNKRAYADALCSW